MTFDPMTRQYQAPATAPKFVIQRESDGKFFWADGGGQCTGWSRDPVEAYLADSIDEAKNAAKEMNLKRYAISIHAMTISLEAADAAPDATSYVLRHTSNGGFLFTDDGIGAHWMDHPCDAYVMDNREHAADLAESMDLGGCTIHSMAVALQPVG